MHNSIKRLTKTLVVGVEGFQDMVKRLIQIKDIRVLVKQLTSKGGATTGLGKKKDVLSSRNNGKVTRYRVVVI